MQLRQEVARLTANQNLVSRSAVTPFGQSFGIQETAFKQDESDYGDNST
jgi:hypothetical protein